MKGVMSMSNETKKHLDVVIDRFAKAGITIRKIDSNEDLKTKSWIMPTNDRKGMIKLLAKSK